MANPTQIIIAENNEFYRNALVSGLADHGIETIAVASNGKELLELLKSIPVSAVLLDVEMPVMNGSEALAVIKKEFPQTKVIILSMHDDNTLAHNFIERGACAYIIKDAVRQSEVIADIINSVKEKGFYYRNLSSPEFNFTKREIEVLQQMMQGCTAKQTGENLNVSEKTVEKHRGSLYEKTNTQSLAGLLSKAFSKGFMFLGLK